MEKVAHDKKLQKSGVLMVHNKTNTTREPPIKVGGKTY